MVWRSIGTATLNATTERARIGYVKLPPQDGIELMVRQTSGASNFKLGYCLLYVENEEGRELGTIKAWPKLVGEAYKLGAGLSSLVGGGIIWVEPRACNLRWIRTMGAVSLEVFADEQTDLPQDRYEAPGFATGVDRLLTVARVGSFGRLRF